MALAIETDREKYLRERAQSIDLGGLLPHQSIYKYVSLSTKTSWNYFERTFSKFEIVGATLNSLNDPFEGKPRLIDDLTDERIEECCWYFDKVGSRRDARDHFKLGSNSDLPPRVKESLGKLMGNARILSFCGRSDSPLLWSHYANAHRGACIHFSASAFKDARLTKGAVAYERHRPVVPLSLPASIILAGSDNHHLEDRARLRGELFRLCFFTKPQDWAYEEEVRIIYQTNQMTNVPFDAAGIFEVILGKNIDKEDEDRVRDIVSRSVAPVQVRKAFIDEDTFSVGIS